MRKGMFYPLLTMIAVFMVMLMVGTSQATMRIVDVGDQAVIGNLLTLPVNVAGSPIFAMPYTKSVSDINVLKPAEITNAILETSGAPFGNMAFAAHHPFISTRTSISYDSINTCMNVAIPAQMVTAKNDSYIELNKGAILSDETAMIKNGRGLDNINGLCSSGEMAKMMTAKMDSGTNKPNAEIFGHYNSSTGGLSSYG